MADTFSINIDASKLSRTSSNPLVGGISISFGEECFPEAGWSDFAALLLVAWTDEIVFALADRAHVASCHFMEGPFFFRIIPDRQTNWQVELCERRKRGEVCRASYEITPDVLLTQLATACDVLVAAALRMKLEGADIDDLRASADRIKTKLGQAATTRPH